MEYASIEREMHIDASPETTYEVISSPEHLVRWWPDEAEFSSVPGENGRIRFTGHGDSWVEFTVVEAMPPSLFSFRWTHPEGSSAQATNSYLVVFELEARGSGTALKMTETGFREQGWDEAKVAAEHADHTAGWGHFLPRLVDYAAKVGAS